MEQTDGFDSVHWLQVGQHFVVLVMTWPVLVQSCYTSRDWECNCCCVTHQHSFGLINTGWAEMLQKPFESQCTGTPIPTDSDSVSCRVHSCSIQSNVHTEAAIRQGYQSNQYARHTQQAPSVHTDQGRDMPGQTCSQTDSIQGQPCKFQQLRQRPKQA